MGENQYQNDRFVKDSNKYFLDCTTHKLKSCMECGFKGVTMSVRINLFYIYHNKYRVNEATWANFELSSAFRSRARINLIFKFNSQLLDKYIS